MEENRTLFFHFPLYLGGSRGISFLPAHDTGELMWRAVPSTTVMKGPWKLIHYYEYDSYELFNLEKDISEQHDLSKVETEVAGELRDEIRNIMESETSWNVSERSIEDFIDGVLEDDLLEEFNAELKENTDLMAELALREHINKAIGENDIHSLRAGLNKAQDEAEKKEVKSIVMPRFEIGTTRFWRNSVAMIIVLVGLAGIVNTGIQSMDRTYDKTFESSTWASERSLDNTLDVFQDARVAFQTNEWNKTIHSNSTVKNATTNIACGKGVMIRLSLS